MADERGMVAETSLDHAIGELDRSVQIFGIVVAFEAKVRPLIGRRKIVARERVSMSGGPEHGFVPPSDALQKPLPSGPVNPRELGRAPRAARACAYSMRVLHRSLKIKANKRK